MPAYRFAISHNPAAWMIDLQESDLQKSGRMAAVLSEVIPVPSPTLVLVGGALGLSPDDFSRLEAIFTQVIAPFAEAHQLVVIDGGTDCGVMRLMGQARQKISGTFPLVGVVMESMTYLPGATPTQIDQAPLEPNHSHFVMVPGAAWGDESSWIAQVADAIAPGLTSATLLVNGGAIALHQDVPHSVQRQRPVVVIAGSGRTADIITAALEGSPETAQLMKLVETGLIQAVQIEAESRHLENTLAGLFGSSPSTAGWRKSGNSG